MLFFIVIGWGIRFGLYSVINAAFLGLIGANNSLDGVTSPSKYVWYSWLSPNANKNRARILCQHKDAWNAFNLFFTLVRGYDDFPTQQHITCQSVRLANHFSKWTPASPPLSVPRIPLDRDVNVGRANPIHHCLTLERCRIAQSLFQRAFQLAQRTIICDNCRYHSIFDLLARFVIDPPCAPSLILRANPD